MSLENKYYLRESIVRSIRNDWALDVARVSRPKTGDGLHLLDNLFISELTRKHAIRVARTLICPHGVDDYELVNPKRKVMMLTAASFPLNIYPRLSNQ